MTGLPSVDWEDFRETVQDASTEVFEFETVTLTTYTQDYDPDTGETGNVENTYQVTAEPQLEEGSGGETTEAGPKSHGNLTLWVNERDLDNVELRGYDEGGRPSEVTYDGERYVVANYKDEHNGLYQLDCREA